MSNSKIKIRGVVGKETFAEITEDEFEQVAQAIDADEKLHDELKEYHTEWYAAEISDDPLAFADVPICSRDVSRLTRAVCKDQNAEQISILLLIEYTKVRFGDVDD